MARGQAYEFIRDIRGTIFGNANRALGRVVMVSVIADRMGLPVSTVTRYLWFAEKYGLVRRACGGYVI